jgi:hypothetical protein
MSNDYRIQKERLAVVLTTTSGERIAGQIFVHPHVRLRSGREEAPDVLNAAEPFFPFLREEGEILLLAKDRVRDIALPTEIEEAEWLAGAGQHLEVVLDDGTRHRGILYLESTLGSARVLDYLNRVGERFLTLHTDDGSMLINRSRIECVRPLE